VVVDATECEIQRPTLWSTQREFYSGKAQMHSVKYEVGVQRHSGKIVWLNGPFQGTIHDMLVFWLGRLYSYLLPGEMLMCDSAYLTHYLTCVYTACKGVTEQWQAIVNYLVGSPRIVVEHAMSRLKAFKFTQQPWRHDLRLHEVAFKAMANILNVELLYHPVHQT
jgi:hypothetical protein